MNILYVCKVNLARSQIAESLHNKLVGKEEATSAGIRPGSYVGVKFSEYGPKLNVVRCLRDEHIDITSKMPKKLTPEMLEEADKVIVMAEPETWPDYLKTSSKVIYWEVKDPGGSPLEVYKTVKNEIKKRIEDLIQEL